jgi:hypothetical protein
MVSIDEFMRFIGSLNNFKELPNGDIIFIGTINYRLHRKIVNSVSCEIRMHRSSLENGVITFVPEEDNYANEYHTRFDPNWQDYEFDTANKILIVSGDSIKLGEYKVEISELSL